MRLRKFLSAAQIKKRVQQLADEICAGYENREAVVLGIMNGALFFLADLLRRLPPTMEVQCRTIASYAGTQSTGTLQGLDHITGNFRGRHVLIVDDILDTGLTLGAIRKRLIEGGAKRIDVCVLLRKHKKRRHAIKARWVGFDIGDEFVVGYGLDYNGRYRSLRDICVLELDEESGINGGAAS
jgi:hypoxanthine phosphoribosyltransferase